MNHQRYFKVRVYLGKFVLIKFEATIQSPFPYLIGIQTDSVSRHTRITSAEID